MTPAELLDAVTEAGGYLAFDGEKVRVRGAKLGEALLALLREHKAAVLEEWQRRSQADRDRYCRVPPAEAPMLARGLMLVARERAEVAGYVERQGEEVNAWMMSRGQAYAAQPGAPANVYVAAAVDVICWQRQSDARAAVQFVMDLKAADESMRAMFAKRAEKNLVSQQTTTKTKDKS